MPRRPLPTDYALGTPAPRAGRAASRLLWGFDASDARLLDALGQAGTFARAGDATLVDSTGVVRTVAPGQPRFEAHDLDGDGVRERLGLRLERASVNRVPRSATPSVASWMSDFSVTLTAGWQPLGDYGLAYVRTTGGGATNAYAFLVDAAGSTASPFDTDGPKGVSVVVAPPPGHGAGATTTLRLVDSTASADRLTVTVTWAADGSATASATVGTLLGLTRLASGAVRVLAIATAVTSANAHLLVLQGNASAGGVLFGMAQAEEVPYPTSWIPTTAGVAGTRAAESLQWPLAWRPQDVTAYVECARPAWAGLGTPYLTHAWLAVGTLGVVGSGAGLLLYDGAGHYVSGWLPNDGGPVLAAGVTWPAAALATRVELLARAGFHPAGPRRVDVEASAAAGGAVASVAGSGDDRPGLAYADAHVRVGGYATGTEADTVLFAARVAPGLRTLTEMRGLR